MMKVCSIGKLDLWYVWSEHWRCSKKTNTYTRTGYSV